MEGLLSTGPTPSSFNKYSVMIFSGRNHSVFLFFSRFVRVLVVVSVPGSVLTQQRRQEE